MLGVDNLAESGKHKEGNVGWSSQRGEDSGEDDAGDGQQEGEDSPGKPSAAVILERDLANRSPPNTTTIHDHRQEWYADHGVSPDGPDLPVFPSILEL